MFQMGSHDLFEYLKHKLWPKERLGVKVPIWLPPTKSQQSPNAFRWRATYPWKYLSKGYNFASNFTLIKNLHKKLWPSKVLRVLILGILGIPGQNDIWMEPMWLIIENTIRRKVVASLKSWSWWVLWIRVCPWFVHAQKVLQLHTLIEISQNVTNPFTTTCDL
jgi:hypothetical protein